MEAKAFLKQKILEIETLKKERLAEKQKQADELGQQSVSITRYRNGASIMRFPLFSTKYANGSNGRQQEGIRYSDSANGIHFEVTPNAQYGMPDQVDGNILRVIISKAREIHYTVSVCPSNLALTRCELLRALDISLGGKNYEDLHDRLDRLAGTQYKGNIFYKDEIFTGTLFSFSYPTTNDPNGVVNINLNHNFKEYLDQDKAVLAISDEILKLKSPLEIRLRELIQVHMGKEKRSWSVGLTRLSDLCQTKSPLKEFKRTLKGAKIPYFVDFTGGRKLADQIVKFTVKERQPNPIAPIIDALVQETNLQCT